MDALDTQLLLLLAGARKRKREEYELYARNVRAYVTSYFSLHVVKLSLRTRTLILRDNISQPDQCTWRVGYHVSVDFASIFPCSFRPSAVTLSRLNQRAALLRPCSRLAACPPRPPGSRRSAALCRGLRRDLL